MNEDEAWERVKRTLSIGHKLRGVVSLHAPYGIFVKLRDLPFLGLVQITDFKDEGRMTMEEYPHVGSMIEGVLLGFKDKGKQIWLGVKPSQLCQSGNGPGNGTP